MHRPLEGGGEHFDEGDWAWLARLFQSHSTKVALTALVTEGMIDDFFGAWVDPNDKENAYSPDEDWRILLNLW